MVWSWTTENGDPSRKPGVPRRAGGGGGNPLHQRVLDMQAAAGNAAVQQLIRQDAGEPGAGDILRYGSRGESVKRLQEQLNQSGRAGPELKVDGIMGALTTAAVREFQKNHPPLDVDGTVGPEVWAELKRVGDQGAPMAGASAFDFFDKGKKLYAQGRYALAFDEFAKAHELDPDPAYLFNMAQALRLVGGRQEEAVKLYEQFVGTGPGEAEVELARTEIAKLRGPGPTGDAAKDEAVASQIFEEGRKLYRDSKFGPAYDEFTKAHGITRDPALLWNRAVALRSMGGRRSEAIALFEQVMNLDTPEDKKAAAKQEIAELRGPLATGDAGKDSATEADLFKDAQAAYDAEDYAVAYDGFTKAWQVTHSAEMAWNRAQARRLQGGYREEAIKLYQGVLVMDIPDDLKKSARIFIAELKGPTKAVPGGARSN